MKQPRVTVIVPSRGRAGRLSDLIAHARHTAAEPIAFAAGVDEDDPALDQYRGLAAATQGLTLTVLPRMGLQAWTNHLALELIESGEATEYLASLGDDHRPRTHAWDTELIRALGQLDGPGFAYGNDGLQDGKLPTAVLMHTEAAARLGWMMLPACEHMYVDNAWLALGQAAGRIVHHPRVFIEHLHPYAGKAVWDASYRETNATERYADDRAAFQAWQADPAGLDLDVKKLIGADRFGRDGEERDITPYGEGG